MQETGRRSFFTGLGALLGAGIVTARGTEFEAPKVEDVKDKSLGDIFNEYPFEKDRGLINPVELTGVMAELLRHKLKDTNIKYINKPSRFDQQFITTEIKINNDELDDIQKIKYRLIDSVVTLANSAIKWNVKICNQVFPVGGIEWSNIAHNDKVSLQVVRGYYVCANVKITKLMVPFVWDEEALLELSDEEINAKIREQMSTQWENKDINYFKGRYAKF